MSEGTPVCSIDGCDRAIRARGWCSLHYKRWRAHGTTDLIPKVRPPRVICRVEDCVGRGSYKGWCVKHYQRWLRLGQTDLPAKPSPIEHMLAHVAITSSGCWEWLGARSDTGYGHFRVDGREQYVHRLSYEHFIGPIPDGLTIDHVWARGCVSRACCNPAHLEAVTYRVNVLRGNGMSARHARQIECVNGHPLSGSNLYIPPRGGRMCRQCQRERNRLTAARRRARARA